MRFLADENFNNDIVRGILRRIPAADITRVQDTALGGVDDNALLAYAATNHYILLTHDVNTLRGLFYIRVNAGLPVPGVFLVRKQTPIGRVVEALELVILASDEADWVGKITFLP